MEEMEIEVYKSLLEVQVLLGVPKNILIYTAVIFVGIFALTENFLVIPIWFVTHFVEVAFSIKDPQLISIYVSKLDRSSYFSS